jgi:hypothetical protein
MIKNMKRLKNNILIMATFLFATTGCMTTSIFQESIEIDAPASIIFQVITNYESYDELIPMLHKSMEIVSETKSGKGVEWKSTGEFKGHRYTSVWTVTEYIQDRKVVMKELERNIGECILETKPLSETKTLYTHYISTRMYKPYEQEFLAIYKKEMAIIKKESERIYLESKK